MDYFSICSADKWRSATVFAVLNATFCLANVDQTTSTSFNRVEKKI